MVTKTKSLSSHGPYSLKGKMNMDSEFINKQEYQMEVLPSE